MSKSKTEPVNNEKETKITKIIVTEKAETTEGIQKKTTTITCSKDNFDSAIKKLNLDPEKFKSGGTSVTRKITYTNSSGTKEVIEETVETYNAPESLGKSENGTNSSPFKDKTKINQSSPKATGVKSNRTSGGLSEPKSTDAPPAEPGKFEEECLAAHNELRKQHGVPSLTLSKDICDYSKAWADHLAAEDRFEHRSERKYGENIYMKWSSNPNHQVTGKEAVDSWYSEIKDFTFGQEPTTLKSGHFTQVIWKQSKMLGVACARSKTGKILVVANYDPAGNFVGRFTENVPPKKKQ